MYPVPRAELGKALVGKGRASYMNVYWSAGTEALVPPAVVTLMPCSEAAAAGETAVISVEETTVKLVAAPAPPKPTLVAPVKPVPVMVTVVPPDVVPDLGEMEEIVGAPVARKLAVTVAVAPRMVTSI